MSSPSAEQFTGLINELNRFAAQMQAKSERLTRDLAASAATERTPEFDISVNHGQVLDLVFHERASRTSPVQLRERVLEAFQRAASRSGHVTADVLEAAGETGSAETVRTTTAAEVGTPEDEDDHRRPARTDAEPVEVAEVTTTMEELWADPTLDDEIVTGSTPDELMADVEDWQQYRPAGDPESWQPDNWEHELNKQLATMWSRADEVQDAMRQLSAEVESKLMSLRIKGGGLLADIRFRPGASGADAEQLTADFRQLYQQARAELNERALAVLGTDRDIDDPTVALLTEHRDQAREAAEPESDDPRRS